MINIATGIKLVFPDTYGMCFTIFILLPILLLWRAKLAQNIKDFTFTKDKSDQLKGLFILIVILHHISQRLQCNKSCMIFFKDAGYLAVGMFFFISGFGLMKSLIIKENYLDDFFKRRILRIYFPFIIVNILTLLVLYLKGENISLENAIQYIVGIKLIDSTLWFIVAITLFYFFFYIIYSQIKKLNHAHILLVVGTLLYILFCKITHQGGWKFVSIFCFPLGILYAWREKRINSLIYKNYFLYLISAFAVFLISFVLRKTNILFGWHYLSSIFFSIFIVLLALKMNLNSSFFKLCGIFSLELYLLHIKVLHLWQKLIINSGLWLILYLGTLLFFSFIFRQFYLFLYKKIV